MEACLVSLEPSGRMVQPGMLALVELEEPRLLALRTLDGPSPWKGGYARGLLRWDDGSLLVAGQHRVMRLDPRGVEIQRIYTSEHFEDLHGLARWNDRELVMSTFRREILLLDPESGALDPFFAFDDDHLRHPNDMLVLPDGTVLVSCHGGKNFASVWRVHPGPPELVWRHHGGRPLRQVHSPTATDEGLVACESGGGRLVAQAGWSLALGGWCRGLLRSDDTLVVGVNPFHDPRPDAFITQPELSFVEGRVLRARLPLGVHRPWQIYTLIPARSGDLGVSW